MYSHGLDYLLTHVQIEVYHSRPLLGGNAEVATTADRRESCGAEHGPSPLQLTSIMYSNSSPICHLMYDSVQLVVGPDLLLGSH